MLLAVCGSSAMAAVSEDNWQTLEQWDQGREPTPAVALPSEPVTRLLPSLDTAPAAPSTAPAAAAAEHKVDFAGLPPLFERVAALPAAEKKSTKSKTSSAKPAPVLPDPIAEVGRHHERRGLALTLPGPEKAPADKAATASCVKPPAPAIDPRLASDRATLAALQNAVKSVGAEQAFDFMLPEAKTKTAPMPAITVPEIAPLTLSPLL